MERVENEISEELIAENRDYMFKVAVEKYEEQLRDKGIGGKSSLQLKLRRGERASSKCAEDMIDMVLYAAA